eukprot:12838600-Alexandrium_andersonii.AAC.1
MSSRRSSRAQGQHALQRNGALGVVERAPGQFDAPQLPVRRSSAGCKAMTEEDRSGVRSSATARC